jgi:hypothetical protein
VVPSGEESVSRHLRRAPRVASARSKDVLDIPKPPLWARLEHRRSIAIRYWGLVLGHLTIAIEN